MPVSLSFWAKLGNETWPDKYHPVVCHLIDVGQVARRLWSDVCRSKVREWVTSPTRTAGPRLGRRVAGVLGRGARHRQGVTGFPGQGKTDELKRRLAAAGFNLAHTGGTKPHGFVSTAVLAAELTAEGRDWTPLTWVRRPGRRRRGRRPPRAVSDRLEAMHGPLGNERWAEARRPCSPNWPGCSASMDGLPRACPSTRRPVGLDVCRRPHLRRRLDRLERRFFEPAGNPDVAERGLDLDGYVGVEIAGEKALRTLGWLGRADRTGRPYPSWSCLR